MIASEREHLSSLLHDLEAKLSSERTSHVAAWFQALEEAAKEAGLLWVVAEPPPKGQFLGSPHATKIVLNQEKAPGERVRRTIVDPPVEQTCGILEVRLPASGARLCFGVGHPNVDRELDSDSTCEGFVERLAEIADAALLRLASAPGADDPWADSARDQVVLPPFTETDGVVHHQVVNMARDITSGISLLTDTHYPGNLSRNEG